MGSSASPQIWTKILRVLSENDEDNDNHSGTSKEDLSRPTTMNGHDYEHEWVLKFCSKCLQEIRYNQIVPSDGIMYHGKPTSDDQEIQRQDSRWDIHENL